jgi:hypothetical protein
MQGNELSTMGNKYKSVGARDSATCTWVRQRSITQVGRNSYTAV